MSNLNTDRHWGDLSEALNFVFDQRLKDVHTALPGLIETFDAETRRARVQPAIQLLLTDGELVSRPPLVNVPVVFPSGGGFSLLFPLQAGDPLLVVFSQRGLTLFKRSFSEAAPDIDRLFDISDAVALAGFGPLSVTPATTDGASLQSNDGTASLQVEAQDVIAIAPGEVRIEAGGDVNISADGDATITAQGDATITAQGDATITAQGPVTIGGSRIDLNV